MEGKIVCNTDFTDEEIEKMKSLSSFETLVNVAQKAYEKEKEKEKGQPVVGMIINIPMFEKKSLPFDLNSKPRTNNRKPRSSPIDVVSLLPCLHQKRKQDEMLVQECSTSGDFEFCSRNPKRIKANSSLEGLKREEGDCSSSGGVYVLSKSSKRVRLGGGVRIQGPPPRSLEPKLPLEYQQRIAELGGSDIKFVIEKKLFQSDVRKSQSRLTMQLSKCKVDFGDINEMRVKVIQPADNLKEMIMTFNYWATVSSYVFTGSWNELVLDNDLKIDDVVQVWSFRKGGELSFGLVVNKRASSSTS